MEEDITQKRVRFITSGYVTLFFVDDGGEIEIRVDGIWQKAICRYIDEYHVKIGSSVYHICEFAETMERLDQPCRPVLTTAGYPVMIRELIDAFIDPAKYTETRKNMKEDYEAARHYLRRTLLERGAVFTMDGLYDFLDGYFYALKLFKENNTKEGGADALSPNPAGTSG